MEQRSAQWLADRNHAYNEWRRAIREHGRASQEALTAHAAFEQFSAPTASKILPPIGAEYSFYKDE